jgi:hypothetical protein
MIEHYVGEALKTFFVPLVGVISGVVIALILSVTVLLMFSSLFEEKK